MQRRRQNPEEDLSFLDVSDCFTYYEVVNRNGNFYINVFISRQELEKEDAFFSMYMCKHSAKQNFETTNNLVEIDCIVNINILKFTWWMGVCNT